MPRGRRSGPARHEQTSVDRYVAAEQYRMVAAPPALPGPHPVHGLGSSGPRSAYPCGGPLLGRIPAEGAVVDVLVCGAQKPFVYGGAEQHQENLVAAFRAAGHEAELVRLPVAW